MLFGLPSRVVGVAEDASVVVKVSLVLKLWLGEFSFLVGRYSLAARQWWLVDGTWLLASLLTLPWLVVRVFRSLPWSRSPVVSRGLP